MRRRADSSARLWRATPAGPSPRTASYAAMLRRLRDYLMTDLDEPVDVATLARMTRRSQFHFSRVFRRSVGVSPYRYIVYLRLRRAVELVREGRLGLAEIAASTGFADQSHLSRWVRRVHGESPTQMISYVPRKRARIFTTLPARRFKSGSRRGYRPPGPQRCDLKPLREDEPPEDKATPRRGPEPFWRVRWRCR